MNASAKDLQIFPFPLSAAQHRRYGGRNSHAWGRVSHEGYPGRTGIAARDRPGGRRRKAGADPAEVAKKSTRGGLVEVTAADLAKQGGFTEVYNYLKGAKKIKVKK